MYFLTIIVLFAIKKSIFIIPLAVTPGLRVPYFFRIGGLVWEKNGGQIPDFGEIHETLVAP